MEQNGEGTGAPVLLGDLREFATPICISFLPRPWDLDIQREITANIYRAPIVFQALCKGLCRKYWWGR